jgi:hypothetical protein
MYKDSNLIFRQPDTSVILKELYFLYPPLGVRGVEDNGFEPLTPCVQGRCSSQLS